MSRLQEALEAQVAALWDLPIRTHGRRVGVIMQSGATTDEFLAEAIMSIRMGTKTDWTHDEVAALEAELKAEEKRLDRWLVTWGAKARAS